VIAKKNHTLVTLEAKEATCSATGLTAGTKCSVCNTVITAQQTVDKKAHTYGEWSVIKNATETEDGSMERSCSACSEKETAIIPATGVQTTPEQTTPEQTTPDQTTSEDVTTTPEESTTPENTKGGSNNKNNELLGVIVVLVALIVVAGVVILILLKKKKN
jgi:cobalamin biosynthesis Mg chelatase CobN